MKIKDKMGRIWNKDKYEELINNPKAKSQIELAMLMNNKHVCVHCGGDNKLYSFNLNEKRVLIHEHCIVPYCNEKDQEKENQDYVKQLLGD